MVSATVLARTGKLGASGWQNESCNCDHHCGEHEWSNELSLGPPLTVLCFQTRVLFASLKQPLQDYLL